MRTVDPQHKVGGVVLQTEVVYYWRNEELVGGLVALVVLADELQSYFKLRLEHAAISLRAHSANVVALGHTVLSAAVAGVSVGIVAALSAQH